MSPEGLTRNQEKLADLLFVTKTDAPVPKRKSLGNGKYELYKSNRPTSPVDFSQSDEEFALKSHETNIEGPLSPVYINLRELPDVILDQIGVVFKEMGESESDVDVCTGIPNAGDPLAKSYSKVSGIKQEDIFDKEDLGGGKRRIVAKKDIKGDSKKLRIVDDLVTKADTKVEAAEAAKAAGFELVDITVLVDRQQGGMDMLRERGINVRAAFTIGQLLKYGLRAEHITQEQYDTAVQYLGLPA